MPAAIGARIEIRRLGHAEIDDVEQQYAEHRDTTDDIE
jgi:hypothetical protein